MKSIHDMEREYGFSYEEAKKVCLEYKVFDDIEELPEGKIRVTYVTGELEEEWEESEVLASAEEVFRYAKNMRKLR